MLDSCLVGYFWSFILEPDLMVRTFEAFLNDARLIVLLMVTSVVHKAETFEFFGTFPLRGISK